MTKILIAEDSPTQAERLKILLEDSNYEVMIAKDGKTALSLLHDFQPDLIISDIQMPRMNGFELCWQVKSNPATRNIPVILLTSLSSKDDVLNGIESGADSFINKPYSPDYLIYYVKQTLIQSQQGNRVYDEVNFETVIDNKKRLFTANPQRMMSLLISTYESARNKNRELVEAQDELQKSEEKYRELFQNAEVGMYRTKLDGSGIVAINPKLCEILGYTEEEIFMMPNAMTWANPEARREMLAALKETGILRNYEMEILTKNKEVRTCSISVKLDTNQDYIEGTVLDITERKQAESKIKESEEKFRKVFENSPMGKLLTSIDGKLSVNDAFCEIVGYPREELSQMNWREISHPGDMEATQNFISSMLSGAINNAQFHKRYIHKSGKVVWTDLATYLQRDSNGEPQFFITSVSDITKQKQTEEELYQLNNELERRITERTATLRKNKEQFKTMFTKAPLGIALIDSFTGKIKKANPIYARITGRTIREITATDWMSITHPDDIHLDIENMNLLNDGKIEGFRREKRYIHKNGDIVWINMTIAPLKIEKEYNPHHLCMIEDITERKKDEEALHVINSRNRAILKAIPDLVFRINSDGVFLDYRTQESSDLYVSPDKIIGQRVEDILPPDIASLITRRIHTLMESGEIQEFEYALPMPDGLRYFDARMAISDTDEVIIIVRNITDRKKVENELIKAKERAEESDRLKSSFLANMSHEIRTPMNGILGFADLLKEPNLTGEQQQEYIEIIEKSGARMLNIINNIIDISKIEANLVEVNIKPSNINEQTAFIYTFFESQTEKKGINLICKNGLPDERAIINTDKEKMYAILTNLVRNAFKYCDEGGIEFGYNLKGKHLEFFVKDTGIGIPDNRQQAIFDRFIQADVTDTRAFQGAGLGLSISKAYVEILGGKIWVESEEGKGSTFYFTIPYHTESEEKNLVENIVPDDEANNYAKNLNILIAEDDKISRMLLTKTIKVFSKEIIEAMDGVEALEACQNNPDIDLVMMDINMPNMDGHEATKQIRQFNKNVIIIAQTANAFDSDKKEAMESGCNDFISKPIMKNELLGLINKYF